MFFCSSRRRHTRFDCDWSSDVCSSDLLYSRNRLNVAVSRAHCLAVIFASPLLLETPCNTIEQMRLVNALCWAYSYAQDRRCAEIGRASCRERGEISVGAGSLKKKKHVA